MKQTKYIYHEKQYLDQDGLDALWVKIKQYVADHSVTVDAGDVDLTNYVTQTQLEEALANIDTSDIDLSGYETKTDLVNTLLGYAKSNHNHDGVYQPKGNYLTEHQSLDGYATENYVSTAIANAQLGGDGSEVDLSGYATKDELNAKANSTHTHTMSDITDYEAPTVPTKTSDLTNDSDFTTKSYVDTQVANASSGDTVDLSNYYTKTQTNVAIGNATQDLVTYNEVNAVLYEGNYATKEYVDNVIPDAIVTTDGIIRKENDFEGTKANTIDEMPAIQTYAGGTVLTFDKEVTIKIYTGEKENGCLDKSKYVEYTGSTITIPNTEDGYLTDYVIYNPITEETETVDPNIFTLRTYNENYNDFDEISSIKNLPSAGSAYPTVYGVSELDITTLEDNDIHYEDEQYRIATDLYNKGYRLGGMMNYAKYSKVYTGATVNPNTVEGAITNDSVLLGTPINELSKVNTMGLGVNITDFSKYYFDESNITYASDHGYWKYGTYNDGNPYGTKLQQEDGCYSYLAENDPNGNRLLFVVIPPGETYTVECLTSKIGWKGVNKHDNCKTWGKKTTFASQFRKWNMHLYTSIDRWILDDEVEVGKVYDSEVDDSENDTVCFYDTVRDYYSGCAIETTVEETGDDGGHFTVTNEINDMYQYKFILLGISDYTKVNDIKIVKGTVPYSELVGNTDKDFVVISSNATTDVTKGESYTLAFLKTENNGTSEYARYSDNTVVKLVDIDDKADKNHTHTVSDISDYVPIDAYTKTETDTAISEAISNIPSSGGGLGEGITYTYNTEIETGETWIDGKPIYMRVFHINPYSSKPSYTICCDNYCSMDKFSENIISCIPRWYSPEGSSTQSTFTGNGIYPAEGIYTMSSDTINTTLMNRAMFVSSYTNNTTFLISAARGNLYWNYSADVIIKYTKP